MKTEHNKSRRDFLKTAAFSTAAIVAGKTVSLGAEEKKEDDKNKMPIGVQLYSISGLGGGGRSSGGRSRGGRGGASSTIEVPQAFAEIKKMGYDGVEFAGFYSYDNRAEEMKKLLDDNGLKPLTIIKLLETNT